MGMEMGRKKKGGENQSYWSFSLSFSLAPGFSLIPEEKIQSLSLSLRKEAGIVLPDRKREGGREKPQKRELLEYVQKAKKF